MPDGTTPHNTDEPTVRDVDCHALCVQHRKPLWQLRSDNKLTSLFMRGQFCFELNLSIIGLYF